MEHTSDDEKMLEEQLISLQPVPSARFYRSMARAAWTPRAIARRRALVVSGLTVVFAALLLSITPQGRTWAQDLIHFFTCAQSDALPLQPFQMTGIYNHTQTRTPILETETPEPGYDFSLSIAEAGKQAGFTVRLPSWQPEILIFKGASYEPDHNIVRIFYQWKWDAMDITNGLVVREECFKTSDDCSLCGLVGASEQIEPVMIGNTPGEYVMGVWSLTDKGPVWESTPFLQTLRWQADEMAFELMFTGTSDEATKADMIAIAESMK